MKEFTLICKKENEDTRIDKFIYENISKNNQPSRNKIQELIKNNKVKKNNIIFDNTSYKIKTNDIIKIETEEEKEYKLESKNIPLDIVYEDDDLLVINKQQGITTHAGAGNYNDTLVNALLFHCGENLSNIDDPTRPGIVHRLDKDTSGLMVVAKNNNSHNLLKKQIEERTLKRTYNAIIWGNIFPQSGIIDGYIDRCKNNRLKMELTKDKTGKYSLTNYKTIKYYNNIASLIECKLDTGRTHQIRVHLSSKKHPLIGDKLYGGYLRKISGNKNDIKKYIENFPRQALHSKSIRFTHPTTKEDLFFEIELPKDIKTLIEKLEELTI